jgi:hypothetical protein
LPCLIDPDSKPNLRIVHATIWRSLQSIARSRDTASASRLWRVYAARDVPNVSAIAIDDKVAIDECYATGNLMVEFKRRFPGEDPKAGC